MEDTKKERRELERRKKEEKRQLAKEELERRTWIIREEMVNRQKQLLQKHLEPKEEEIETTDNDEGGGDFPFPYITKPPKPPDDLALAGQGKLKEPITEQVLEYEPYCKHCGAELPKGQAICHVCNKKSI